MYANQSINNKAVECGERLNIPEVWIGASRGVKMGGKRRERRMARGEVVRAVEEGWIEHINKASSFHNGGGE